MNQAVSRSHFLRAIAWRALLAFFGLGLMFFLSAGTWQYWQAWVYIGIVVLSMLFIMFYLYRFSPELLERRLRIREKQPRQKLIILFSFISLFATFILPGFDRRLGLSHPPLWVVLGGEAGVLLGFLLYFLVMRENRFASRIVEVEPEQQVISSGPYAVIRHPMYSSNILIYLFTPLALGSYWAVIPALLLVPLLTARIINEEKILLDGLKGYAAYRQKVQFRLFPGIW